jgi:hypothetical protein
MSGNVQVLKSVTGGDRRSPEWIMGRKSEGRHSLAKAIQKAKLGSHLRHQLCRLFGFEIIATHDPMIMPMGKAATAAFADSITCEQTGVF